MSSFASGARGRRRLSIALAVVGAALALIGGVMFYLRENVVERDGFADRAELAFSDQRVRLAVAQPITDAIVDSGPAKLVNARPLIESVVVGALGTPPARAAFGAAADALEEKLFQREPNTLLLNLVGTADLALGTLESVAPQLADEIPAKLRRVHVEITASVAGIDSIQAAEEVRFLGLLLPPLALLLLIGSVVLAPDRRRGLIRASLSVLAAALVGMIVLAVLKNMLVGHFDDDVVADAVTAVWEALFDDLGAALLLAAVIAVVLAAAARFTDARGFDPLAPFVRAGELLRHGPESTALALLRAVALAAIGIALILKPELSLEAVAVIAGTWFLYVAVGELLGFLAPRLPAAGGEDDGGESIWSRLRPGRVTAAAAAVVATLVAVVVIDGGSEAPARPPGPPPACNGYPQICDKRIDEVTFPATHNSMSAAQEPGWFLPNQRFGIRRQLDDGIRGLLIDTHYGSRRGGNRGFAGVITDLQKEGKTRQEVVAEIGEEAVAKAESLVGRLAFGSSPPGKSEPYLCHVLCELGATRLDVALAGIDVWMQRHPDEFLVIFIEDVVGPEETAAAFRKSGLLRYAYTPTGDPVQPTLGELIERDQRLLVMAENDAGGGKYPWYQQGFDLVQETPYTFHSVAQIESPEGCRPNRGGDSNPLFQLNSWIETIPRDPDLAARIDSHQALLRRSRLCTKIRGLKPNLLNVDFYDRGDVIGVAKELNGIPASEQPQVRTLR